jgi:hypothetical protein
MPVRRRQSYDRLALKEKRGSRRSPVPLLLLIPRFSIAGRAPGFSLSLAGRACLRDVFEAVGLDDVLDGSVADVVAGLAKFLGVCFDRVAAINAILRIAWVEDLHGRDR